MIALIQTIDPGARHLLVDHHRLGDLLLALCLQRRQSAQPVRRHDRQLPVPPDRAGAEADPPLAARSRRHRHFADHPAAPHLLHPPVPAGHDRAAGRLSVARRAASSGTARDGLDLFVRLTPKSSNDEIGGVETTADGRDASCRAGPRRPGQGHGQRGARKARRRMARRAAHHGQRSRRPDAAPEDLAHRRRGRGARGGNPARACKRIRLGASRKCWLASSAVSKRRCGHEHAD